MRHGFGTAIFPTSSGIWQMPRYVVLRNEQTLETFEDLDEAREVAKRQKLMGPHNAVCIHDLDSDWIEKYETRKKQ